MNIIIKWDTLLEGFRNDKSGKNFDNNVVKYLY